MWQTHGLSNSKYFTVAWSKVKKVSQYETTVLHPQVHNKLQRHVLLLCVVDCLELAETSADLLCKIMQLVERAHRLRPSFLWEARPEAVWVRSFLTEDHLRGCIEGLCCYLGVENFSLISILQFQSDASPFHFVVQGTPKDSQMRMCIKAHVCASLQLGMPLIPLPLFRIWTRRKWRFVTHVVKGASILTQEISAQLKAKLTIRLWTPQFSIAILNPKRCWGGSNVRTK